MGHLKSLKKNRQQTKLESVARNGKNIKIHVPKENEPRMSDILLEFAEPMLVYPEDEIKERNLIQLAIVCWNMSYLSEDRIKDYLDTVMHKTSGDIHDKINLRLLSERLIEKRKKYYPDIKRFILDFQFTSYRDEDTVDLQVTSIPVDEDLVEHFQPIQNTKK